MSTKNKAAQHAHGRGITDATTESQYMYHHSNYFGGGFEDIKSPRSLLSSLGDAILATAFVRCWHILVVFLAWATAVSLINHRGTDFTIQPTLLTVFVSIWDLRKFAYIHLSTPIRIGTVIGFIISYRTTASFERYNEGRRYWSQIIMTSRTLSRAIWFHVPESSAATNVGSAQEDDSRARTLIEKKTVINLVQAFSVAVKHYLRGEEGISYEDLYHLVRFLPSYVVRATSTRRNSNNGVDPENVSSRTHLNGEVPQDDNAPNDFAHGRHPDIESPFHSTGDYAEMQMTRNRNGVSNSRRTYFERVSRSPKTPGNIESTRHAVDTDIVLKPASMPPKSPVCLIFPFSLFTKRSRNRKEGSTANRASGSNLALMQENVPLEIASYLSTYVAILQRRKVLDVPTTNLLITFVNQLQDALTGLERIVSTPIPFSYSMHLWVVTIIYCLALPLQIWSTLKFLTIPATGVVAFVLFGFLVAGEEN